MATKLKKSGLGKGLESLLLDNSIEDAENSSQVKLKLSEIEPNKDQARKYFNDESISELADSISKHGVLQPLLVRPLTIGGYQLIAGERRWRASRLAGLTEVPVIIKNLTDEEAAVISLIENLQRENLNPIEEARGFEELVETFGLTQEEAAEKVGKSRSVITNSLRLLKLPEEVINMIFEGKLSAGHAKMLAGIENEKVLISAAKYIIENNLSVRQTEQYVKSLNKKKKQTTKSVKRNSYFDEVELALNNSLGRKTKVITKGKKECGTLELAFSNKEDLALIVKALSALE